MATAATRKRQKTSTSGNKAQAIIELALYDGTRQSFPSKQFLLRVLDGNQQQQISRFLKASQVRIKVPFSDNFGDNHTVLVASKGYRDAGFFPVKVSRSLDTRLDLMLVPKKAKYSFQNWTEFTAQYPRYAAFLACGGDEAEAKKQYENLAATKPPCLALLLNLTAAMSMVHLPAGTPLDYFKQIEWDRAVAQDRFFALADEQVVQQVKIATAQKVFVQEPVPGLFHGDATSSFKQVQFGEANVQLTFHERTVKTIGGVRCIRVEADIDYYKDIGAHTILEVIPNTLSRGLTDPQLVYVLRWIAGRHAGVPEFDPGYTLS